MSKKIWFSLLSLIVILALAFLFLKKSHQPRPTTETAKDIYAYDKTQCPAGDVVVTMEDVYFRGIIEKGEKVTVTMNWYQCHPIQRGDIVLYRYSSEHAPVIKRVIAGPGDRIHLEHDTSDRGWNLYVNEKMIISTKVPYFFGHKDVEPPLKLYEQSHSGVLQEGTAVLLSSFPPGDKDSGTFGVVSTQDIIGKVLK